MLKHIIYVVVLFPLTAFSQDLQYSQYDLSEGLPSNETYFTYQDSMGYIWVGTDRGLVRYDGYRFKIFTTSNSNLTYNTIFNVFPASNGELWFTCYDGSVTIYDGVNQKMRPFRFNDSLRKWNVRWTDKVFQREDTLYLQHRGDLATFSVAALDESSIKLRETNLKEWDSTDVNIPFLNGGEASGRIRSIVKIYYRLEEKQVWLLLKGEPYFVWSAYCKYSNDEIVFSIQNTLYGLKQGRLYLIQKFDHNEFINHVYRDSKKRLFVLTRKGLYQYRSRKVIRLMDFESNHLSEDREGNYWLSTTNDGVIRIPKIQDGRSVFSLDEGKVLSMSEMGGCLIMGTDKETIAYMCESGEGPKVFAQDYLDGTIKQQVHSMNFNQGKLLTTNWLEITKDGNSFNAQFLFKTNPEIIIDPKNEKSCNLYLGNGKVLSSGPSNGYFVYREAKYGISGLYTKQVNQRILCMHEDSRRNVWLGTLRGVWHLKADNPEVAYKLKDTVLNEARVNAILETPRDIVVFATSGNGVVLVGEKDTVVVNNADYGLISDLVNCISLEGDSILWVGTNSGVSRVKLEKDLRSSYVSFSLNTDDGLLSNFIYSIKVWDEKLWLGSINGFKASLCHQ